MSTDSTPSSPLGPLRVSIARRIEAAPTARGHVVVIDVLRAFTTAAYALASGAERIVLVSGIDEAFALRARLQRAVLVGESAGRKIEGFDHGNSPAEIADADLTGRTVILRSSSGTQGVVQARAADAICLGSLVTAAATVRYLRAHAREVTLLAMGSPYSGEGAEDDACAEHMSALLRGGRVDVARTLRLVRESEAGRQALDPAVDWTSTADLERATAIDRFDFALPVVREDGLFVARAARR